MFPIRDHNPSLKTPWVTWAIIAINLLAFVATEPWAGNLGGLWVAGALYPGAITEGAYLHGLITHMFLHAGFLHLAGNMLFLWVFGDNLEEQLGHVGFALFYVLGGLAAAIAQIGADPTSGIPMVGASGAIAAVMGGYLLLFPRARIDVLFIIVVIVRVFPVPAWVVLGAWFALQLFNGTLASASEGGVAYWAHAGGFAAGVLMMLPAWFRRGGPAFWSRTHGHPPHAETHYARSNIPIVRRRR